MLITEELNRIFDQFNQFVVLFVSDVHDSENVGETFVSCLGHSTFLEQIVADIAEDFKLLYSGESICSIAILHHVEHHFLGSNHFRMRSERKDNR